MIRLFLARHGTVFADGETKVMLGLGTDRPMSDVGRAQVADLIASLKRHDIVPDEIHSGTLKRHRETAAELSKELGVGPVQEASALDEISYGTWEGLNREEVAARDAQAFEAFKLRGEWAEEIFGMKRSEKEAALKAWLDGLWKSRGGEGTVLAVSSMGTLRTLYGVLDPAKFSEYARRGRAAEKTGVLHAHWCEVELHADRAKIVRWNVS